MTKEERATYQRAYRLNNGNRCTKLYEKTIEGFLMRLYRNMKSRITGVQALKVHLYLDKELIDKEEFYKWAMESEEFHKLLEIYRASGYERKLCPSVDRIDSNKGYAIPNMEWVTMSENSRRGAVSRHSMNKGLINV